MYNVCYAFMGNTHAFFPLPFPLFLLAGIHVDMMVGLEQPLWANRWKLSFKEEQSNNIKAAWRP